MDLDDSDQPNQKPQPRIFKPGSKGRPLTNKAPSMVVKSEPVVKQEPVVQKVPVVKPEPVEILFESNGMNGVKEDFKGDSKVEEEDEKADDMDEDEKADDMDEDDYVVREIDVFFNPRPDENTQMYVMQYPLRPSWRRYELDECCKEVRVKSKSAKVEMDIELDTDARSPFERFGDRNTITKTLKSSGNLSSKVSYTVGVLKGNELYLNPVHAILQLRPSASSADDDDEEEEDLMEEEDGCGTKALEDVQRKQPIASSKKQDKTISSSMPNSKSKESWIPLKYHSSESNASSKYKQMMMTADHSPIPLTVNPLDFLNSICPRRPNDNKGQAVTSKRLLISSLSSSALPLEERFRKYFNEGGAPAYRFSVLKYVAPEASAEDVIELLKKQAVLVQGLWVPKNSTLQPEPEGREAVARDFVILRFSKNLRISDEELRFKGDMGNSVFEVVKKFAVHRDRLNDWKFKEPADPAFVKLYPKVAEQQQDLLKEHEPKLMAHMNKFRPFQGSIKTADHNPMRTAISAPTKKSSMPIEKREALLKALEVLFKNHSVNSFETICRGLRDMVVSVSSRQTIVSNKWMAVAASCIDGPREEMEGVIREFATPIHGAYVSKSSLVNPELNPLRDVVIKLFLAQPPNGKLKKANVMEGANVTLKRDIPDNDYLKVMNELCDSTGGTWMLKRPSGKQ